jgi:hypothetical protein
MADEKLSPERAVRLLRAKAEEMESRVIRGSLNETGEPLDDLSYAIADIALIATLLADLMEYVKNGARVWGPEPEDWGRDGT